MSRVSQTIKNIISGISQQPQILRLPEQLDEQINGFSTESSGLQKRPPTLYVRNVGEIPSNREPLVHIAKRDESEKYIMMFDGKGIRIWDTDGNEKTVTYEGDAQTYVTCEKPREKLRIVTIADYTFIVNRTVTVKMSDELSPSNLNTDGTTTRGALINVKSGQYGRTYSIKVNGEEIAKYTTPNGDNASHTQMIDTNYIRDRLEEQIKAKGYEVSKGNSWLYFYKTGIYVSKLEVSDGFNGQGMFGFLDTAQKFTNLPSSGPNGYLVKVLGDAGSGSDDYYVKYNSTENVWEESCAPQIKVSYDMGTMPHTLVRNADGSFTLKTAEWEPRKTGDDDSNPFPSFVDTKINEVFMYRNRLGFLADENIILSKSASFFDFWIASAVEVQDTDPIDIAVSNNRICTLYYAVQFAEDLILFSNDTQFILSADGALTPQNATAPLATNFTSDVEVKPVSVGRRLYFTAKRAQYTMAREYYTMDDTRATKNSQDITSHVPSYLVNGVYDICSCENENLLIYLTTGDPSRAYIYKYLFTEEARMQSSWSYWEFNGGEILGGGFINSEFFMLIVRGNSLYLEKMTFTYNTKDYLDEPYRVFLDRKAISSPIDTDNYDSINDRTQLHIANAYGDDITKGVTYGVVTSDEHFYPFTYEQVRDDDCWVNGNITGQKVVIGECYEFVAGLSRIMIKHRTDAGIVAEEEGRLQLTRLILNFSKSGYFEVHVDHNDPRDNHVYYHTARILGEVANRMGQVPLETGQIKVPLMSVNTNCNIYITSKAPTALSLIGFTWEGNYIKKTRSV